MLSAYRDWSHVIKCSAALLKTICRSAWYAEILHFGHTYINYIIYLLNLYNCLVLFDSYGRIAVTGTLLKYLISMLPIEYLVIAGADMSRRRGVNAPASRAVDCGYGGARE